MKLAGPAGRTEGRGAEARAGDWPSSSRRSRKILLCVPQPPDADVPVGKDDTENVRVRQWGTVRQFDFAPKDHAALGCSHLGMIDVERGVKLAGIAQLFPDRLGCDAPPGGLAACDRCHARTRLYAR